MNSNKCISMSSLRVWSNKDQNQIYHSRCLTKEILMSQRRHVFYHIKIKHDLVGWMQHKPMLIK